MTANVITYRGKLAAREAGKVLGFDVKTLDRLSKRGSHVGMERSERYTEKQFREAGLDFDAVECRSFYGSSERRCRICRGISASIPEAW